MCGGDLLICFERGVLGRPQVHSQKGRKPGRVTESVHLTYHATALFSKELLDPHNGYVSGDTVSIRLTLTLSNTRGTPFEVFRDAHAFPSDVKLIVEGESFYANKGVGRR